eukprot:TRINITY_DN3918_c0_g1_i1.p1 TRINITY_DN3918_c0_g1~~TRINITY_DN3918_c0_g1_i1.p1  ORF type:complete len:465 (+),score=89.21 TRINITY_DN3918_c0_g1_i1:57-1451(+)
MSEEVVKVSVKWGAKKYDNLELALDESVEVFQLQLYSLTNVLPEKQKILTKGQLIKATSQWRSVGIKNGQQFVLMGTAEASEGSATAQSSEGASSAMDVSAPSAPHVASDPDVDQRHYPVGLRNLGNTCYMNATLQCLAAAPEFIKELGLRAQAPQPMDGDGKITHELTSLLMQMKTSPNAIPPFVFWTALKTVFPQFGQTSPEGFPMQQDAEECWGQLITSVANKLGQTHDNVIDRVFGGEFQTTITCEEGEEPVQNKTESFRKLSCHISSNTNHLLEGLKDALDESVTKHSSLLNRDAVYRKSSRISKLPPYLTVSFVRFFWKPKERVKAKILRAVRFQHTLDVYTLCTDELKQKLDVKRKEIRDGPVKPTTSDQPSGSVVTQGLVENQSGNYELCAVLTHIGRSADSGHYVAWVKDDNSKDDWFKFDDEKVSIVPSEEILKLQGGGDWHIAYICLYRTKRE